MKQPILDHKAKLKIFRDLIKDRGENHPIAKAFNVYANRLEAQIKQAEAEGLKSFDESKYKIKP
jgi:hypothetical protein